MNTYICLVCDKIFTSALGLSGHKRMHGPSGGTITQTLCSCVITKTEMPVQYLAKFQKSLKPCKHCNKLFKPAAGRLYFCNHSCSASFNNTKRGPRSEETKEKISRSLRKNEKKLKPKKVKTEVVGPYSKLFICKCNHCKAKFISRMKKQHCPQHRHLYSISNKSGYKFTFNVYHYPDLFDINLLKSVGWFGPGGKSGRWNINGLSRDHKVSITEAIVNNYDPYYITHPLNCELMPHSQNNIKKTNSSIAYNELKQMVDAYDLRKAMCSAGWARTSIPF